MKTNQVISRWLLSLSLSLIASSAWATTYNTTFTFDVPTELGAAPAHGSWYPDRYRPAAFESYSLDGQNVLKVGIDGAATGQNDSFHNTQGRKLDLPTGTTAISAKLYVPADWLTDHRRADLWATNNTDDPTDSPIYPIIGFANVDGKTPVIRYWTEEGWVNTSIAPVGNTWYRFEIVLNNNGNFDYLVDGVKVGEMSGTTVSTSLRNIMVQAYNFNDTTLPDAQESADSYESYWDDIGYAYPTYDTTVTFDEPTAVGDAKAPGVWYPDRYRPAAFVSYPFNGQNVLKVGIDGAATGQNDSFYNTQGRKLDLPAGTTALSAKLYVPEDWLKSHRRSDLWATGSNPDTYPIIGFANLDGKTPVIRYWTEEGWVNTKIAPAGNTWYRFEILLNSKGKFDYLVNGVLVGETTETVVSTYLSNAIVQAYNFNDPLLPVAQQSVDSYESYWDDIGYNHPGITNITDNTVYSTLGAAVAAADPLDVIELAPRSFTEAPVNINKAITIRGANHGVAGTGTRTVESRILDTNLTVTASGVVIDGLKIDQTNNTASALSIQATATVKNSIIRRDGVESGKLVRGIELSPGITGYVIEGNLFTGDSSGGFFGGHKTWNSGMYVNGGSGSITGNTFENCRSAINLDDFNSEIVLTGNTFRNCGTYLSFGGATPTTGSYTIAGNEFFLDRENIATNWLPSALFNNSNVGAGFRLNAIGNTFGGVASAALTNEQKFQIEARISHRGRGNKLGVVDFVAGEQVVVSGTTIGSAVAAAGTGDTVRVGPGTYAENLVVAKAVNILGPNAEVSGNGKRVAEAIVVPGTSAINGGEVIHVAASGVSIRGLTIDGNNPALTSGYLGTNGADIDASEGVTSYETDVNNLTVTNNIFRNLSYFGVSLYPYPADSATSGHVISGNLFKDLGTYDAASGIAKWGGGVLIYNNQYARVTDNVMTNVRLGVQTGNFHRANPTPGFTPVISGNTIEARRTGIFHNNHYAAASSYTLSNNTITALANPNETAVHGILLASMNLVPSLSLDNTINMAGVTAANLVIGYEVWNTTASNCPTITGGSVNGAKIGLLVTNNNSSYGEAASGSYARVSGLEIKDSFRGIQVFDQLNSSSDPVSLEIGDGVSVTGGSIGFTLRGDSSSVSGTGNLAFSGQSINYIELKNHTGDLDATKFLFNGKAGSAMNQAGLLAVESKVQHKNDDSALGLVTWLPGLSYESWKAISFNQADRDIPAVSDPTATPAGDGISNLMKYALALNPRADGSGSLPKIAAQNGNMTLTYRKNKQAKDVRYTVQVSSSLDAWSVADEVVSRTDMGGYWEVTVRDIVPQAEHPQRFMRLIVEN